MLGAVLAIEGTEGYWTLINGPGGCRSRVQNLLRELHHNYNKENPGICNSCFMSRQSRSPCTFLNPDDMIMGSGDKITEGLDSVSEHIGSNVVLVETMCASIQVVEREKSVERTKNPEKVILSDQELSSMSFAEGFDDTMLKIIKHINPIKKESDGKKVNILGYGVMDSSWEFGKDELSYLLKLLNVEIISFIGCDKAENIRLSGGADANILIHPELCHRTSAYYKETFGIPQISPSLGSPIGYPAIKCFVREIAEALDLDPTPALEEVCCRERKVHRLISNVDKIGISLHSYGMAIEGLPSDVLPIIMFARDILGLVPQSIKVKGSHNEEDKKKLETELKKIGCEFAMDAEIPKIGVRAIFTDGLTAEYLKNDFPSCARIGI